MARETIILCENLVKIHKVADLEIVALQGLDLAVQPGELLAIVGPSGSGKSTLLNILGGLDRPSAGRVFVDGNDLLKMSNQGLDHYRRSVVGFVWQQGSRNLVPYLSALENVQLPITLAGYGAKTKSQRAAELLDAVGLADRMNHRMEQLSGGEQQRVAIAVSLANSPKLLLADEPTGELDTTTSLEIYALLQKVNREFSLTTIIVSHDPNIRRHVERVVSIRDGKTATETLRLGGRNNNENLGTHGDSADQPQPAEEEAYTDLIILDSAGRFQIPKEYREQYNLRGRVQLELVESGIMVKAAPPNTHGEHEDGLVNEAFQDDIEEHGERRLRIVYHRVRRLYHRVRRSGSRFWRRFSGRIQALIPALRHGEQNEPRAQGDKRDE